MLLCLLFDLACFFLPSFSHLSLKHVHRLTKEQKKLAKEEEKKKKEKEKEEKRREEIKAKNRQKGLKTYKVTRPLF